MASPLEMTEMYDNALLGILQHVGNIQHFLHVYFGFLYRKTDFYRLLTSPTDSMGFPPGVAEKMVLKTFRRFEQLAQQDRARQLGEAAQRDDSRAAPPAVQEVEVKSEPQRDTAEQHPEAAQVESPPSGAGESSEAAPSTEPDSGSGGAAHPPEGAQAAASGTNSAPAGEQQHFQADPDSYNGAVRDNYSWSQDYTDVEVRVTVPKTVVKGAQVCVSLQTSGVRVCVREGAGETVLLEGEFSHKINTEDSLWSLEPGRCVVLSLAKSSEVWWSAVLKGEKEIDINKINRERSMATVDEEEHAVLDRLTFDYHQKLQGKPQSHEMKVHEMLKKGWDAEGSPFKGQQFDPSMFDIPPGAVQF
ncbi:nudC domain-containing protein 3 [Myripristis murdjan]|uniref:nudC domain-containing protein 3 n=1 Tax=Myripristis murdjan TaxID=586833 RepID=UPI0011763322|nr:nudC domain-containing protein 3 [Myripristis murdjan]